jgi:hypothetical protein
MVRGRCRLSAKRRHENVTRHDMRTVYASAKNPGALCPGFYLISEAIDQNCVSRNPASQIGQTVTFQNQRPSTLIQHGPAPYAYHRPCQRWRFSPYQ